VGAGPNKDHLKYCKLGGQEGKFKLDTMYWTIVSKGKGEELVVNV
jgi:hypothetical protein